MNFNKKIYFVFFLWIIFFFLLLKIGVFFFVGEFKNFSQNIVLQKKVQNLLELRIKDFENFQKNHFFYQSIFKKIENSFVNKEAPIEFMEFLEKEAKDASLSIKISPFVVSAKEKGYWVSLGFQILLQGNFSNCLRFLERVEQSPWLVEILQINVEKISEINDVRFSLKIKVFTK